MTQGLRSHLQMSVLTSREFELMATHLLRTSSLRRVRGRLACRRATQARRQNQASPPAFSGFGYAARASRRGGHVRGVEEQALAFRDVCGFRLGSELCGQEAARGLG